MLSMDIGLVMILYHTILEGEELFGQQISQQMISQIMVLMAHLNDIQASLQRIHTQHVVSKTSVTPRSALPEQS